LIAFIEGTVAATRETSAILSVGGFGIEVYCPRPTLEKCATGKTIRLETYFQVREDGFTLFGFHETDALEVFKLLLSVSGVGPKLALSALSTYSTTVLASAILNEDDKMLSSISGVGKKTAERIVLELKNKLPVQFTVGAKGGGKTVAPPSENPAFIDAVEALVSLGYRDAQVRNAVAGLLESEPTASAEVLIRKSLSKLR
jgi:Holliday junction DNA helicase RuvA